MGTTVAHPHLRVIRGEGEEQRRLLDREAARRSAYLDALGALEALAAFVADDEPGRGPIAPLAGTIAAIRDRYMGRIAP